MATAAEEGVNSGGLISQQEKFSMIKIESYEGLLKWGGGFSPLALPLSSAYDSIE